MRANFAYEFHVFHPTRLCFKHRKIAIMIRTTGWILSDGSAANFSSDPRGGLECLRLVNIQTSSSIPARELTLTQTDVSDFRSSPVRSVLVCSILDDPGNPALAFFAFAASFHVDCRCEDLFVCHRFSV